MKVTLPLGDQFVKKIRKRRERESLERSFEKFQFKIGKRTWKRQDLYDRS